MSSRLRQDLRWITREGSSFCVSAGAGESSFAPYVLSVGHSALASGQITTVPLFLGAVLQNLAPWALRKVGSVRNWSVLMVSLQALCLLGLALGSAFARLPLACVFGLVSLYWAAGWSVGPAWNTWMDSVVPGRLRARFFSRRNAFCQGVQWTTMMAASAVLSLAQDSGITQAVFSTLFGLAGLARLTGAYCMAHQSEPVRLPANYQVLGFRQAYHKVANNPAARPLLYMLGAQLSLQLAAPYVVPFLVQQKQLGYGALMLCLSAATFSKILVLPRLGKIAQKLGPRRLFQYSGLGLAVVPLLWLTPLHGLAWFLLLQACTGACMAAYEMAVTLVYLDAVPAADRTSVLTRFAIFNTTAMMLGSSLGAALLWSAGGGFGAYAALFVLAAGLRVAALRLLGQPQPVAGLRLSPNRSRNLGQHLRRRLSHASYRAQRRSLRPPARKVAELPDFWWLDEEPARR